MTSLCHCTFNHSCHEIYLLISIFNAYTVREKLNLIPRVTPYKSKQYTYTFEIKIYKKIITQNKR